MLTSKLSRWRTLSRTKRASVALIAVLLGVLTWWRIEGLSWRGAAPLNALSSDATLETDLRSAIAAVARTWMAEHAADQLAFKWGEGVLMLGLEQARDALRDRPTADRIDAYASAYYARHAAREMQIAWSDEVTPAIAAAERALVGDADARAIADAAAEYAMHAPRSSQRGLIQHFGRSPLRALSPPMPEVWVDSIFHIGLFLVRYAALRDDRRYIDEAARQTLGFLRALQDPRTGLLTHAFDDTQAGQPVPAFAEREFWARGQAWMLATGVELLHALDQTHPAYAEIEQRIRRLERVLRSRQSQTGLFHTLVLRDDSYEETAGSALIVYAMARGVRYGLFGEATHAAAMKGGRGLLAILRHDAARVEVTGTSLGTNPTPAIYAWVPTASQVSYGIGAWLLAASEIMFLSNGASSGASKSAPQMP